ncbi:flagellar type III secretion system pore protein FliP [Atopococcus tabaci]|uniref:flagellar type III secretion system pore protein FliP n=1 Tax=Atopococcus tabaci TaxID=269774 RepID=UPI00040DA127|nr:flagellar type III secretion system pore protein FliP [Atopococcus tabaci]
MWAELMDAWANYNGDSSQVVNLYILFFIIALVPTILVLTTSFTRTVVVLSFTRNALGTQQSPPNLVLTGLALFLTLFIMRPVYTEVTEEAVLPFLEGEISREEAFDLAEDPIKEFMLDQTRGSDVELFVELSGEEAPETPADLPLTTVVPAFAISELRTAFTIGFLIFVPFLIIDIVIASILMSMGMFMLSPVMVSLPFKLLLFVLVDGWYLIVESLVKGFM